MVKLHRLVYTSFRADDCNDDEIRKILQESKKHNSDHGITGFLLHTDDKFIQVVEGEKEYLIELYDKVKMDSRHWGINLRAINPIDEREFPDWHMAYKDVSNEEVRYETDISTRDLETFEGVMSGMINYKDDEAIRILKLFLKTA